MNNDTENRVCRLTTALIASAFALVIAAFAVDQLWGIARFEFIFRGIAGLLLLATILCVLAGWWLSVRYLFTRNRAPASPAEYLLLVTAIFIPIAAIYVLRSIRRHEESPPTESVAGGQKGSGFNV